MQCLLIYLTAPSGHKDLIKTGEFFFRLPRQFFNSSERRSVAKAEFLLLFIKNNILTFGVRTVSVFRVMSVSFFGGKM